MAGQPLESLRSELTRSRLFGRPPIETPHAILGRIHERAYRNLPGPLRLFPDKCAPLDWRIVAL
jgi:hypothetical protein